MPKSLAAREFQVIKLVAKGRTRRQIAVELGIRVGTVQVHRSRAMAKLGLSNLTDLIGYAIRSGMIES